MTVNGFTKMRFVLVSLTLLIDAKHLSILAFDSASSLKVCLEMRALNHLCERKSGTRRLHHHLPHGGHKRQIKKKMQMCDRLHHASIRQRTQKRINLPMANSDVTEQILDPRVNLPRKESLQRIDSYSRELQKIGVYTSEERTFFEKEKDITDADATTTENAANWRTSLSENIANNRDLYTVLMLCFLVGALSSLDRVAMSVAILPLSQEYGLSETVKGQISSIFSIGYGLGILPAGILIAYASPKKVMAGGVALWSVATLATPVMASFMSNQGSLPLDDGLDTSAYAFATTGTILPLLATRAVMGTAESVVLPTLQKILASWVPPESNRSSLAVAGVFAGFQLGTITAYGASANVIDWYGSWEGIFYVYGMFGILWLLPWLALVRDSPGQQNVQSETLISTTKSIAATPKSKEGEAQTMIDKAIMSLKAAPVKEIVSSRGIQAMTVAHAANNWGLYNNLAWAPTFFQEQFHLNIRDSALLSVLPPVAGAALGLVAGSWADSLLRQGNDKTTTRKIFQFIALFGPAVFLTILSVSLHNPDVDLTPVTAQALLTASVGLQAFNAAGYGAAAQDKAGKKWSGLIYSLTSLPGVILGSAAVFLTGQILDATNQDWSIVYGLNALVFSAGACHFILNYNSKREFD